MVDMTSILLDQRVLSINGTTVIVSGSNEGIIPGPILPLRFYTTSVPGFDFKNCSDLAPVAAPEYFEAAISF
jgi:hypothetical protein